MSSTSARRILAKEREHQALELKKAGVSYRSMAEQMHVSVGAAHAAVKRALTNLQSDVGASVTELVKLEIERIDRALLGIWPLVAKGDLLAIDRFVRLSELRAKYLGLFAPTRSEVQHDFSDRSTADLISEAESILRQATAGDQSGA